METYIINFIQSVILIALTPLFLGILKKFKALLRGYTGPSIFQIYYDLQKLFQKGRVHSNISSFITSIGPIGAFSGAVTAALLIPVFYTNSENDFGNLFIVIFVLALVKFFNSLLGLDCSSTFGGMGSSREMFISMLAEPIVFIIIAFLYFETKSFNIFSIAVINSSVNMYDISHIIAGVAFIILLLGENTRMPFDNPETHLELTMVHEAMILDMSGADLAFLELASAIKLIVFLTIFINCFMPVGIATSMTIGALIIGILAFLIKLVICLFTLAVIETSIAKSRLFRVPELFAAAFSISIIAIAINYFV